MKAFQLIFIIFIAMFAVGYSFFAVPVLAVVDCSSVPGTTLNSSGICVPTAVGTGLSDKSISAIIVNVLNWLMAILGIIAILLFVVAGFKYLMAAGDEKAVDDAKNIIKNTVIGLVVALTAFVVVRLVANLLGVTAGVGTGI